MSVSYSCNDFMEFQEALKKMRDMDDKIIYALNTSIPTESFQNESRDQSSTCRELYNHLKIGHQQRDEAIKNCIMVSANAVKSLREERDNNKSDFEVDKKFRAEQRKLRLLQTELNIEDIVKDRSYKAFNERCRSFFHAGTL